MGNSTCFSDHRVSNSFHNALVWPLPPELTVNVISMTDTRSVCNIAATCLFFNKCAMDPLCFANIHLSTLLHKVDDALVSTMIQRAGNDLQSLKLVLLPSYLVDKSTVLEKFKLYTEGKKSAILTGSCLSSLSGNNGAPRSHLRRLHLFDMPMDDTILFASLSVCPSLVDLEIEHLEMERSRVWLEHILKLLSKHCPLLERLMLESSGTGSGGDLNEKLYHEFVLGCPNITTLALKGFSLRDSHVHILVKGFHVLKHVDFSDSYKFTGSILKNIGKNGGGNHLEVMILCNCISLKQVEVEKFMEALLAGDLTVLRHLDISNSVGLESADGDYYYEYPPRCVSTSFLPIEKLLEQRPGFCLVAEFPKERPF